MKKLKILLAAFAVGLATVWSPVAMAWGPERETYTMESPAPHATFNSITNNTFLGDERDFVRIVEDGTSNKYANEIKLEAGKTYIVYIGYHNDAGTSTNETGAGISKNTRVMTGFPKEIAAGEQKMISAKISSSTATPAKVWDEVYVNADEDLKIEYVAGSAIIHNNWALDGTLLPDTLFTEEGALIGVQEANGTVYGCDEFSGHIVYRIRVYKEDTPPPDTPPEELPPTGPAEIVMAVAIVAGVCGLALYLYHTKRTLKKVSDDVTGRDAMTFEQDEKDGQNGNAEG